MSTETNIQIKHFALGMWQTNCFVLFSNESKNCIIFDAGFDPQPMIDFIKDNNLTPQKILLTHAHLDHVAGVQDIRDAFPDLTIPLYLHEAEKDFPSTPDLNLSGPFGMPLTAPSPDHYVSPSNDLSFEGHTIQALHVPGHSPGSIAYYLPDFQVAIVGDTLFAQGVGRTDLATSDGPLLMQKISSELYTLPDETTILPGHGPFSTIAREKANNPYIRS